MTDSGLGAETQARYSDLERPGAVHAGGRCHPVSPLARHTQERHLEVGGETWRLSWMADSSHISAGWASDTVRAFHGSTCMGLGQAWRSFILRLGVQSVAGLRCTNFRLTAPRPLAERGPAPPSCSPQGRVASCFDADTDLRPLPFAKRRVGLTRLCQAPHSRVYADFGTMRSRIDGPRVVAAQRAGTPPRLRDVPREPAGMAGVSARVRCRCAGCP
jgi:hypothetical protein